MFKKSILSIVVCGFTSFAFAHEVQSTLLVKPDKPENWAFHGAAYRVNHEPVKIVSGDIILVKLNDVINLVNVAAMNVSPRIDSSCQNLQIKKQGHYVLNFSLQSDWLIHCQFHLNY